jgi:hypothetical protein
MRYGGVQAPKYDLDNLTTKLVIFAGTHDTLSAFRDAEILYS